MKSFLSFCLLLFFHSTFAQETSKNSLKWNVSGFLDVYYGYDFVDQIGQENRLPFLYNHTNQNRLGINLALVTISAQTDFFRANLGIQQGTYARDNYANEPELFQWIHQANIGVALDKDRKFG